jgi:hypothetical protein
MSFDEAMLNEACLAAADECVWLSASGPVPVPVVLNMDPSTQNSDGYEVVSAESVTGETQTSLIKNMKRGDKITHGSLTFSVMGVTPISHDWSRIEMEKI